MSLFIIMSARELAEHVDFMEGETEGMGCSEEDHAHQVARACAEAEQEAMVVIRIGSQGVVHPAKPLTKKRPGAKQ